MITARYIGAPQCSIAVYRKTRSTVLRRSSLGSGMTSLEDNFGGELKLACRECGGDLAEAGATKRAVGSAVVDLVEYVECLGPEVEVRCIVPERECFVQAEIGLVIGIRALRVSADRAPGIGGR